MNVLWGVKREEEKIGYLHDLEVNMRICNRKIMIMIIMMCNYVDLRSKARISFLSLLESQTYVYYKCQIKTTKHHFKSFFMSFKGIYGIE